MILGGFAVGLLITGGEGALKTIQTSSVALGMPLIFAWFAMMISFYIALKQDFGGLKAAKYDYIDPEMVRRYDERVTRDIAAASKKAGKEF